MTRFSAFLAAALAVAKHACAQSTFRYQNITEFYTGEMYHGGDWHAAFFPPAWNQHLFHDGGFSVQWVAGPYSKPHTSCVGICPNEYPFLLTLNTTSTPDSVKILASPLMPYGFDLFSAYMGCVANTPTQNDDGSVSYQPQGVPCTIVATGKKDHGSPVTETFEYTAQTIQSTDPGSSTYKAVQYFDFTSPAWHNITFLTFNATTTKTPEFPYAPVLYIDNPSYGAMVETPPQSPNYLNGSINFETHAHGYYVLGDEQTLLSSGFPFSGHQTNDAGFQNYCKDDNVALCPDTPTYKGAANVSDPETVLLQTIGQGYFDLSSFAYGCTALALNGSVVPASCTVEVEIYNSNFTTVFRNITYTAHGPGSAMQKAVDLPSEWRGIDQLRWNATLLDRETFPYPPVLAVDTIEYAFPVD